MAGNEWAFLLLDITLAETITDGEKVALLFDVKVNLLLDNALVNNIDKVEDRSLSDDVLKGIKDVSEIKSLLVTLMILIDDERVTLVLGLALADETYGTEVCSLLEVVLIKATDDVKAILLLDVVLVGDIKLGSLFNAVLPEICVLEVISLYVTALIVVTDCAELSVLTDDKMVNFVDNVEICSLLKVAMVEESVVRRADVTVLFNATVVYENDGTGVCPPLDAAKVGVTGSPEVNSPLDVLLKDVTDGAMITDVKSSMLDIGLTAVTTDVENCSLLGTVLVEITDTEDVDILLNTLLVNIISVVNICRLLDAVLVTIANVLEANSPEVGVTAISSLFDDALVINVIDGKEICSLLDAALMKVTTDVGRGLLFDSAVLVISVIVEVALLLST